jgi:hypothetical protein
MCGSTEYTNIDMYELLGNTLFIVRNIRAKIKFIKKKKSVYELLRRTNY